MPNSDPEHLGYLGADLALQGAYRELGRLRERAGSWEVVWRGLAPNHPDIRPDAAFDALHQADARLILATDPDFPPLLKEISWPPHGIYVRGALPHSDTPAVAVVGTRKATAEGKTAARSFGETLATSGIAVVSGLAFGVDAAAHEGALEGNGYTLAVLATGIDRIYPASHERLAARILAAGGAIVSEYPPGSATLPYRFLERNRLVAGLTQGTVVIEAPRMSGSLATARFALDANRGVFVLPGPARHPNFAGSHDLIRAGAELVTEPSHVLEALGLAVPVPRGAAAGPTTGEEDAILNALATAGKPLDVDKIAEATKLDTRIVNRTLGFLIVRNSVEETASGYTVGAHSNR